MNETQQPRDFSPLPSSSFSTGPGASPGPGASMSGIAPGPSARDYRKLGRLALRILAWIGGLLLVFLISAWISLPTRSIAWRISHEAQKRGFNITIDELSIRPWGSATARGVTWSFAPSRPDSTPVPFVIEELDVDFSVLKYLLFDELDVEFEAVLDEGKLSGAFVEGEDESRVELIVEDLPLYGVPKLQDAVNAPVSGVFALAIDLSAPAGKWADANGRIELHCYSCTIGDGETKLYVPGSKKGGMMSKGVTIPQIDLGTLDGVLEVAEGKAVAEEFGNESDDIRIRISGDLEFADPFKTSRLDLLIKVFITDQLRQRSDQLDLVVATASDKVKMDPPDEGWLGYRLEGNIKKPKFRGIKQKTRQQLLIEKREARKKRLEDRAKRKAEAEAAKAKAKAQADAQEVVEQRNAELEAEAEPEEIEEVQDQPEQPDPVPTEEVEMAEIPPEVGVGFEEAGEGGGEVGGDEVGPEGEEPPPEEPSEEPPPEEQLPQ